jgi:ArsR family transcriptional regulator
MVSKEVFELQSQLCQAMSNGVRLQIVHTLREGPLNVTSLAKVIGVNQANLSRHLAVLRHIGLVSVQRQGQENIYQITNPKIVVICDLMRQVLAEEIARQAEVADHFTSEE